MAEAAALEGSEAVDLAKHPSGIVPTLEQVPDLRGLIVGIIAARLFRSVLAYDASFGYSQQVIMRIREPKTTALIFASGKMVCTGAKSEQQSKLAARKYARIIQKLGFSAKFKDF